MSSVGLLMACATSRGKLMIILSQAISAHGAGRWRISFHLASSSLPSTKSGAAMASLMAAVKGSSSFALGDLDVDESAEGGCRFRRGSGQGVAARDVGSAFPFVEMVKRVAVAADAHGVAFISILFGNRHRDRLARDGVKAGAVPAGDARRDGDLRASARSIFRHLAGNSTCAGCALIRPPRSSGAACASPCRDADERRRAGCR